SRQVDRPGRPAQRRRTRAALLEAAARMMGEGHPLPSVAEVAAAADVSRRTAYRYFPTADQLATEAVLETLRPRLEPAVDGPRQEAGVAARLAATVRQMQEAAVANEHLLRTMIRLTIDRPPAEDGSRHPAARGSRRAAWLHEAIAPMRRTLGRRPYERLLSALCLCVGAEALIALRDVRGLSARDAVEVCVWSADALLRAATREGPASPRGAARRSSGTAPKGG
ncbi:MAG: TetR family transcriptional regulator, partial [Acidobacteriota bacterium]|nr:TetR family transcriptional regulator [Acidobacteriota bacterium]